MHFVDDKTIVPVGEPDRPISTDVRAHNQSLVHVDKSLKALNHDFYTCGNVLLVTLRADLPNSVSGTFYRGQTYVCLRDKIFDASNVF